ncbi:MAG: protoporphyrinogen oxidase [Vulcanimicrobiota bacterium]
MSLAIVGGGLSGLAAAWQAGKEEIPFQLFEASSRLGGIVQTDYTEDGLAVEGGAESCLRSKPELYDLCCELGLESEMVSTIPENSGAFVVRGGQLHPIPQGFRLMAPSTFWPFLRSDLISWSGKFRAGLDLVLPVKERAAGDPEESLSEFVSRRLGTEILHYLAQPLVAGVYGADPQYLSLEATMPLFQRLEAEHGSVIKGLRALGSEHDAQGARYNLFFSLERGFGSVVEAMEAKLPQGSLQIGSRVDAIRPSDDGRWTISVRGREDEVFDSVVVALPAPGAAELLAPFLPEVAREISEIICRPAVTVNLIYEREAYLQAVPRAYGFVVPAQERRPLLACTFSSRKWPNRGSEQSGILRTYFGGPGMEWAVNATDEDLVEISTNEIGALLQLKDSPTGYSVHRWPVGLPEYRIGHRKRVGEIRAGLDSYPSLTLAGNYLDGVGLPDCVRLGRNAVSRLALV